MASRSEAVGGEAPRRRSRRAILVPQPKARRPVSFHGPSFLTASNGSGGEIRRNELPVDQRPEALQVRRAVVAMVDVVRVLPHVAGEQRYMALAYRCVGIGGCHDLQAAACILHQPGPARAEKTARGLVELCLQGLETTESFQRLAHLPARALTPGRQTVPEEGVIPYLRGIVEDFAG